MAAPTGDLPSVIAGVAVTIYGVWFIVAWRNRKGD